MNLHLLCAIGAAVALSACAAREPYVELRGRVDSVMMRTVSEALREGRREFAINSSQGGFVVVAQEIAAELTGADATLTVNGVCFSACALLVLGVKHKYATAEADIEIHGAWDPSNGANNAPAVLSAVYMALNGIPAPLAFGRGTGVNLYRLSREEMAAAGIVRPPARKPAQPAS